MLSDEDALLFDAMQICASMILMSALTVQIITTVNAVERSDDSDQHSNNADGLIIMHECMSPG